jgi:uncharacterized membrane protein YidH (DUF202 family)
MATLRRTEAKAFFANERTFLHWMNMAVTLGSISAALLGALFFFFCVKTKTSFLFVHFFVSSGCVGVACAPVPLPCVRAAWRCAGPSRRVVLRENRRRGGRTAIPQVPFSSCLSSPFPHFPTTPPPSTPLQNPFNPGISGVAHKSWGRAYAGHALFVRAIATAMMVLSIFMAVYAARNFKLRGDMLQLKADGPYDSRLLPILLASVLIVALLLVFGGAVAELAGWG